MKDRKGNELAIGDKVVYIKGSTGDATIEIGTVSNIYKNGEECSVNGYTHIKWYRLIKLDYLSNLK